MAHMSAAANLNNYKCIATVQCYCYPQATSQLRRSCKTGIGL